MSVYYHDKAAQVLPIISIVYIQNTLVAYYRFIQNYKKIFQNAPDRAGKRNIL